MTSVEASGRAPVLRTAGVSVHYGGVIAVDSVSVALEAGQCYGLIGANGSGKSTFLAVISGLRRGRQSGSVFLGGIDCTDWSAVKRARAGIARTFQTVRLIDEMSVLENVLAGMCAPIAREKFENRTSAGSRKSLLRRSKALEEYRRDRAKSAIERVGMTSHMKARVRSLPYGLQRRVEIARAIAADPVLLLLDEPTAGMTFAERLELAEVFQGCIEIGQTILLIEHDMEFVASTCSHAWVLDFGEVIAAGKPEEILKDPRVRNSYLGSESADALAVPQTAASNQ